MYTEKTTQNENVQTIIEKLARTVESKSGESGTHMRRISRITRCLLKHTPIGEGMSDNTVEQIALAAVLHDIGKIMMPDEILNKPDILTEEEYEIMKTHTVKGAHLLAQIPEIRNQEIFQYAYDIARHHHERWDGKGYPDGLKGDEISVWSQVVALADVYDALVSRRVYKEAVGYEKAAQMIAEGQCGAFDPRMLQFFAQAENELRTMYE